MKVKRPNAFIYFIAYALVYPLLKIFFRLDVDRSGLDLPEGAHVVLSNHYSMIDFIFVMLSLYPHRLNAVTAQKYFYYKPLHKFLPMMGCIPKKMFEPDVQSIIAMKTVLNRGEGILLFPEGRCSSSQSYVGMHKSTGKLIKKLGVPVITCFIEGGDICLSHWRRGFRAGRIRLSFRNLFYENELATLSIDEINTAIDANLGGDEGVMPPEKPFQTFAERRLCEGLHKLLYYCPKCEMEFTMDSSGNMIQCTACGNAATMDRFARLTPVGDSVAAEKITLWFRNQVRHEMKSLSKDMEPLIEKVQVQAASPKPGGGTIDSGFGTISLSPEGWRFDGEISGKEVSLFSPVEAVPAISYSYDENYQMYFGGVYYKFTPEDPRKCVKYAILAEAMHRKFSPRVLLTDGKNSGFLD